MSWIIRGARVALDRVFNHPQDNWWFLAIRRFFRRLNDRRDFGTPDGLNIMATLKIFLEYRDNLINVTNGKPTYRYVSISES